MDTATSAASEIVQKFGPDAGLDEEEIATDIQSIVREWSVPVDEAARSVMGDLREEHDTSDEAAPSVSDGESDFNPSPVDSINSGNLNEYKDYLVRIVSLWEPRDDRIDQVGLIGDDSGVVKFTTWENDNLPTVEEGEVYRIKKVNAEEYNGRFAIKFSNSSEIVKAEGETVGRGGGGIQISGVLAEVESGSGLIKRCPEDDCNRVLQNGRCAVHGEVEGEFDLRIKAIIDDGHTAHKVIFGTEATVELTGITIEEAKQKAMDALDTSVIAQEIKDEFLGTYFDIEGPQLGQNILVDDATIVTGADEETLESVATMLGRDTHQSASNETEAAA